MAPVKHLLFVDDEDNIRLTLSPILEKHGFEVTAVANVGEALTQIDLSNYDVLISDLNIETPGDGLVVIAAMKVKQPTCKNVILTAYRDFDAAQQAIRLSVADYFVKPVNIDGLISTIARKVVLNKRRTSRQSKFMKRKAS
jgi:two-component system, response regulator YesN